MTKRTVKLNKSNMYTADFETTNASEDETIKDQRVWLAGFMNVETKEETIYTNLNDFIKGMFKLGSNKTTHVYFHNLKFDGSYLVPYLEENGYKYVQEVKGSKEYSLLIDRMNNWFSVQVQHNKQGKVVISDTLKMFPTALEYLPDTYGTPTRKIIEDKEFYNAFRSEEHVPTEQELAYFHNDLQVLAETMSEHYDWFDGQFKTTQASQAWESFTQEFKAWKWRFPALTDEEDKAMRTAYIGGISYVPPKYAGLIFQCVTTLDENSMYPHKAAYCKLPYGKAKYEEGDVHPPMSRFWVASLNVELKLKENCLPCISVKQLKISHSRQNYKEKWLRNTKITEELIISSIDYKTMFESYDVIIHEWNWNYNYAQKIQKEVQAFVLKNNKIKVEASILAAKALAKGDIVEYNYQTARRQRAKIDNNAFYGKFGEGIVKYNKIPVYDSIKGVTYGVSEDSITSEYKRKYLPVAIAITAYARQDLTRVANTLGEDFLYCDTDSVHFKSEGMVKLLEAEKKGILKIDDTELGAWKVEGEFKRGKYLRPKCYIEETFDGKNEVTLAGLPADPHTGQGSKERSCITFENLDFGTIIPPEESNKLASIRTRTGTKLQPTSFKIKEQQELNIDEYNEEWLEFNKENKDFAIPKRFSFKNCRKYDYKKATSL